MRYHFKVHKEKKGYWAECIELDGCQTQGDTAEELFDNMQEALDLFLSEPDSSRRVFPQPKNIKKARNIYEVPVSPNVALAMKIREERIRMRLTQEEMTKRMEMKSLFSYQRL